MPDNSAVSNTKSEPTKQEQAQGPRFPDLSSPDDLNNRLYRLIGILNYCFVLPHYKDAAEAFWREQDRTKTRMSMAWQVDATCRAYLEAQNAIPDHLEKGCGEYHAQLQQLCHAALPLMEDVTAKLKVLWKGAWPFHQDRQADWQAYVDDLKAIAARTWVLLDAERRRMNRREIAAMFKLHYAHVCRLARNGELGPEENGTFSVLEVAKYNTTPRNQRNPNSPKARGRANARRFAAILKDSQAPLRATRRHL